MFPHLYFIRIPNSNSSLLNLRSWKRAKTALNSWHLNSVWRDEIFKIFWGLQAHGQEEEGDQELDSFTPKYTFILVSPCTSGNLSSSHTTIGLLGLNCTDRGHFFLQTIRFMNYVFISVTDDLLTPWTLLSTFPDVNFKIDIFGWSKFHTWLLCESLF